MTTASAVYEVEERVIASIRALKSAQRVSTDDLRARLGISRTTWFERMKDGEFTIGEVAALAALFRVSVQDIVNGIGLETSEPKVRPNLDVLVGGGRTTTSPTPLLVSVPTGRDLAQ